MAVSLDSPDESCSATPAGNTGCSPASRSCSRPPPFIATRLPRYRRAPRFWRSTTSGCRRYHSLTDPVRSGACSTTRSTTTSILQRPPSATGRGWSPKGCSATRRRSRRSWPTCAPCSRTPPICRCFGSTGWVLRCATRRCVCSKFATGWTPRCGLTRSDMSESAIGLNKTLSGLHLWGIAVGLVISGEYFGWSYGWAQAGTLGFLVTTVFIAIMYTTFIFSFTELTTAIPHAGGPFAYSYRAFGPLGGYVAGFSTLVEFVFAPPAIALAIGAYLNVQFPALHARTAAVGAYAVFKVLNIAGVTIAATFELVVTVLAIAELLIFMGVVSGGFAWSHFTAGGWAGAEHPSFGMLGGLFAAIPFAIWFFLAIEGAAMAAEDAKDPSPTLPRRYICGTLTRGML